MESKVFLANVQDDCVFATGPTGKAQQPSQAGRAMYIITAALCCTTLFIVLTPSGPAAGVTDTVRGCKAIHHAVMACSESRGELGHMPPPFPLCRRGAYVVASSQEISADSTASRLFERGNILCSCNCRRRSHRRFPSACVPLRARECGEGVAASPTRVFRTLFFSAVGAQKACILDPHHTLRWPDGLWCLGNVFRRPGGKLVCSCTAHWALEVSHCRQLIRHFGRSVATELRLLSPS